VWMKQRVLVKVSAEIFDYETFWNGFYNSRFVMYTVQTFRAHIGKI
jgi:hypothetical protein